MKRSSEDSDNESVKKITIEDEAQPSCSGIQSRKKSNDNSDESGSDSELEDNELIRQKKIKKVINGEIHGSTLYLRASENAKGNILDDFCAELIKKHNSHRKNWIDVFDLQKQRIDPKSFWTGLEKEVEWHWIISDEQSTRVKMMGIQRILEFEIASRCKSINFEEFIKYIRRSRDECFQIKWETWEIEFISETIMKVFAQNSENANNYETSDSSSSDEGYVD